MQSGNEETMQECCEDVVIRPIKTKRVTYSSKQENKYDGLSHTRNACVPWEDNKKKSLLNVSDSSCDKCEVAGVTK